MAKSWRNLRVGDRIRFDRMPAAYLRPDRGFHRSTKRLVRLLIERGRPSRIAERRGGMPWIHCRVRRKDGRIEYHYFAIGPAEEGWIRVKCPTKP